MYWWLTWDWKYIIADKAPDQWGGDNWVRAYGLLPLCCDGEDC